MGLCSVPTMAGASMHREPAPQYLRPRTQIRMKRQQGTPEHVLPATLCRHVAIVVFCFVIVALAGLTAILLLSCSS